ncbi:SH3 domain-containing protein [Melanogaster broomeanus]|nr:SH3 domain-containing protein [Melanogaster broomeanus]
MVFTRLSSQEKEAFFGLLDEYFQSRPELLGNGNSEEGSGNGVISTGAAASAVHRALAANPEMTSKIVSAGVTHGAARSSNPYAATMANNAELSNAVGRVAAASIAFSGGGGGANSSGAPTPPLPQRGSNPPPASRGVGASSFQDRFSSPGSEVDKLITKKSSVFPSFNKKTQISMQPVPPAFPPPKNNFAPPPTSRTASPAPPPPAPRRQVIPEAEELQGEWAEVLYDYSSEDPGDLAIEAGSRVFVTAKSSDDWWTGQIEGQEREGLFPASYVKLLQ